MLICKLCESQIDDESNESNYFICHDCGFNPADQVVADLKLLGKLQRDWLANKIDSNREKLFNQKMRCLELYPTQTVFNVIKQNS